ncbi:unnamed protein product, partial [Ectocarpus sp. 4 AP-2014]
RLFIVWVVCSTRKTVFALYRVIQPTRPAHLRPGAPRRRPQLGRPHERPPTRRRHPERLPPRLPNA